MTTRTLFDQRDLDSFAALVKAIGFPSTVSVRKGKQRTLDQNRLQHMWHREAAEQLQDETAEDKRAYAKLHFAVPILRAEIEEFREAYDRHIEPLPYEQKLAFMAVPLNFPCTRLMTTKMTTAFLDRLREHYESLGVRLTVPEN